MTFGHAVLEIYSRTDKKQTSLITQWGGVVILTAILFSLDFRKHGLGYSNITNDAAFFTMLGLYHSIINVTVLTVATRYSILATRRGVASFERDAMS